MTLTTTKPRKIKCRGNCGERFDPEQEGGYVEGVGDCCENCYWDLTFECVACGERDSEEQQRKMLVIAGDVRFLSAGRAKRGIYRVVECPYYGGPLIGEGYLYDESLEFLCDLPPGINTNGYPCGHLCRDCQRVARVLAGLRLDMASKWLIREYRRTHNFNHSRRYDTPIRFRVGSVVLSRRNSKRYLVVGHSCTGESGKSPGIDGFEIKGERIALHRTWLGPEYYCEAAP